MLTGTSSRRHGKENILDRIYAFRIAGGFHAAALVGLGSHDPNCLCELVGGV